MPVEKISLGAAGEYNGEVEIKDGQKVIHGRGVLKRPDLYLDGIFENGVFRRGMMDDFKGAVQHGTFVRVDNMYLLDGDDCKFVQKKLGITYVGKMSKGKFSGVGKLTTGNLVYEGAFQENTFHGDGVLTTADRIYEGQFLNGKPDGIGDQWTQDYHYIGDFKNGIMEGEGVLTIWVPSPADKKVGDLKQERAIKVKMEGNFLGGRIDNGTIAYYDVKDPSKKAIFIGKIRNDQPHGEGKYVEADGSCYEGNFQNGLRHGRGTFKRANGEAYIGEWHLNTKQGKNCTMVFSGHKQIPDGTKYVGSFVADEISGDGYMKFPDGSYLDGKFSNLQLLDGTAKDIVEVDDKSRRKTVFSGIIKAGRKAKGKLTLIEPDGKKVTFEGQFMAGNPYQGIITYPNGEVYNGIVTHDPFLAPHIQGVYENKKAGAIYSGQFSLGKKEGYGEFICPAYSYKGNWRDNKKHGFGTWESNGEMYKGNFINDEKSGAGEVRMSNGIILDGLFVNNQLDGRVRVRYPSDAFEYKMYKDGKPVEALSFLTEKEEKSSRPTIKTDAKFESQERKKIQASLDSMQQNQLLRADANIAFTIFSQLNWGDKKGILLESKEQIDGDRLASMNCKELKTKFKLTHSQLKELVRAIAKARHDEATATNIAGPAAYRVRDEDLLQVGSVENQTENVLGFNGGAGAVNVNL